MNQYYFLEATSWNTPDLGWEIFLVFEGDENIKTTRELIACGDSAAHGIALFQMLMNGEFND